MIATIAIVRFYAAAKFRKRHAYHSFLNAQKFQIILESFDGIAYIF